MKPDKKRVSPLAGLLAGLLLLGVVGIGVATGRMPLAGASNQGIELDRWPVLFWAYSAAIGAVGIAALIWSLWSLAKARRDG